MKLAPLLENLRAEVLQLQQRLVDALDDEFDVSLKPGSRSADAGRDAYSIQVRHPLLKAPMTISMLANGPRGTEVKIGSYTQFDLSHPSGFETIISCINERIDFVKIPKWLLANGFVETDRAKFAADERVELNGSGFNKTARFFIKRIDGSIIAFKLSYDSYQNVQHEWWQIPNGRGNYTTVTKAVGHRIRTFGEVEVLIGALIRSRDPKPLSQL